MVGATSSSNGSVGYVNAVPPKDGYNTKYLRADGTWQVPPDHTYTVNNATLTIQKNGTTVKTFTANANSDVTCNITVPTKTSDLTNDSGFLTSHQDLSGYVPKAGGAVITGTNIGRADNTGNLDICGGTTYENGAFIALRGKDNEDLPDQKGVALICANNGSSFCDLKLYPNGTLAWGNKEIDTIEEQGNNYIRYSSGLQICWGEYSRTSETNSTINFPKAFKISGGLPLSVSVSGQSSTMIAGGWSSGYVYIANTNLGSFTYTAIGRWK